MIRHFFLTLFALLGASLLNTAHATNPSSVSYNALALTSSFPDEVSPSCKENFSKEQLEKAREIFLICPDAGVNAANACSAHFADDSVYTDGSVVG